MKRVCIIAGLLALAMFGQCLTSARAIGPSASTLVIVEVCSGYPAADASYLEGQMALDPMFNVTTLAPSNLSAATLGPADILVLAGASLTPVQIGTVASWVSAGGKAFLLAGEDNASETAIDLGLGIILPSGNATTEQDSFVPVVSSADPSTDGIEWSTAPAILELQRISAPAPGLVPLLTASGSGEVVLYRESLGAGTIMGGTWIQAWGLDRDFKLWTYTPYLFYRILNVLAGKSTITAFANWQESPVPNTSEKPWLVLLIIGMAAFFLVLLAISRRVSRKPIRIAATRMDSGETMALISSQPPKKKPQVQGDAWERVGLHRQISSFYLNLLTYFVVNLPFLYLNVAIYARFIMPFPAISGMTSWIGNVIGSLFTIFDMGISSAMTTYFSRNRVHSPATAFKFAQIYTWWEFGVCTGQALVFTWLATFVVPSSYLGGLAFFTILCSATRLPNFYGVVGGVLNAMQRFDVSIKANAILGSIVNTIIGWGITIWFRDIYATNPRFGEAFGAGVGMYLGGVVNGFLNFMVFLLIYRHLGFSVGNLFRTDFGKSELKQAFWFGSKLTIGNSVMAIAGVMQMVLVSVFVVNYNEELAWYNFSGNLTGFGGVNSAFLGALTPGVSEAYGNGKMKLVEYYLIRGLAIAYSYQFFLFGLFWATGANFLLTSGPQWAGSIKYLYWQLAFFIWYAYAWWADTVFQGTGNSGKNTLVWFVEQGTRLTLMFVFVPLFGFFGLIFCYIPGIMGKCIVSTILIRKKICRFKFQWVHMFFASGASAGILFAILWFISRLFPAGDPLWSTVVLFGGFAGGLVAHNFLTGIFGGWDKNTLAEFKDGLSLSKLTKVFNVFHWAAVAGHRLSPFKDRFAVAVYPEAVREAAALTAEKVAIKA